LTNKVALITGGANGIGRAMALLFARHGADVAICDLQQDQADQVVKEIEGIGRKATAIRADISSETEVQRTVEATVAELGQIDILVNNASIVGQVAPLSKLDVDSWDHTLRVNLTGAMLCSREVLRYMLPRRTGAILNVSSNVGRRGYPNRAPYVCSKWALLGLTQTLALEVAQQGIRVNAICPGPVLTDRLQRAMQEIAGSKSIAVEDLYEEWVRESPMQRFATIDECAQVALFLVSDASSGMTGQALNVTAGMLMT
jgi:NAD(P)-dependent dehydrogenase (short-subunit alcohol dehydrogenase family)